MRFHTYGVGFCAFHLHQSTHVILRTLHEAFGARDVAVAFLRVTAAASTLACLAAVAAVMLVLPVTADALVAGISAVAWTRWLDRQERQ